MTEYEEQELAKLEEKINVLKEKTKKLTEEHERLKQREASLLMNFIKNDFKLPDDAIQRIKNLKN